MDVSRDLTNLGGVLCKVRAVQRIWNSAHNPNRSGDGYKNVARFDDIPSNFRKNIVGHVQKRGGFLSHRL